jgi:hypothetical protein
MIRDILIKPFAKRTHQELEELVPVIREIAFFKEREI